LVKIGIFFDKRKNQISFKRRGILAKNYLKQPKKAPKWGFIS
jgi:hypothetical protein